MIFPTTRILVGWERVGMTFPHLFTLVINPLTRAVEPMLKFQAPTPNPGIQFFWLRLQILRCLALARLQNNLVQKQKKHCIIFITRLNRNPNLRLRLHHLKFFDSGSSHLKLLGLRLRAPALGSGLRLHSPAFNASSRCLGGAKYTPDWFATYVMGHVWKVVRVGISCETIVCTVVQLPAVWVGQCKRM